MQFNTVKLPASVIYQWTSINMAIKVDIVELMLDTGTKIVDPTSKWN